MRLAMPVYGKNAKRELVADFRGYNCTELSFDGGGKSTFSDMLNGGTDKYPFAASRPPRSKTQYDEATCALSGGEVLIRVQPPYLIYGENNYDLGISPGEKQIVRMGTNLLVFPDGKYFNTANGEYGSIDEGKEYSGTLEISRIYLKDGNFIRGFTAQTGADFSRIDVNYVTSSGVAYTSKKLVWEYSTTFSERKTDFNPEIITGGYVPIAFENGEVYYLSEYDGTLEVPSVKWSRLDVEKMELKNGDKELFAMTNIWSGEQYAKLEFNNKTFDEFYVHLLPEQNISDLGALTLPTYANDTLLKFGYSWRSRTLPIFDYVTVCNNRLFGCRCGMPYDGSEPVNRIYVSAPNNFKAFEQFAGISTDSWWGDVSEEGPFTAACTYNGYPMFFKEDCMYILYGDYPPYSYNAVKIRGVAEGAYKSLIELNGALFYKSRHDIMRYTSSSLSSISQALGNISGISRAVGGAYRDSYYISLDGETFVFDTTRGMWAKEDAISVIDFAHIDGSLHFLSDGGKVYKVNNGDEQMPWSLTSPPIGYEYPNRKRLYSLQIRIELGEKDELPTVELSLDGGEFKECRVRVNFTDGEGRRTGSILIPVSTCRCELLRYRISGYGTYKLTGVTKVIKEGGK